MFLFLMALIISLHSDNNEKSSQEKNHTIKQISHSYRNICLSRYDNNQIIPLFILICHKAIIIFVVGSELHTFRKFAIQF